MNKEQIQQLKQQHDIVQYIGQSVDLKQVGNHYKGLCPFHDDKNSSLAVYPATQTWKCYACSDKAEDIIGFIMKYENIDFKEAVARLGGKLDNGEKSTYKKQPIKREPIKKKQKVSKSRLLGKEVCRYPYRNEKGDLLYYNVRYADPKDFRQLQIKNNQEVWKGYPQEQRVLYNLQRVIESDSVIVVEGEKDVGNLHKLGFVATTMIGGANSWLSHYATWLKGKIIYIIPHADPSGEELTQKVIESIEENAKKIYIHKWQPDVKKGYDISDFIEELKAELQDDDKVKDAVTNLLNEMPQHISEAMKAKQEIKERIVDWVKSSQGAFTTFMIDNYFGFIDPQNKAYRHEILNELANEGMIKKTGKANQFIIVNDEYEVIDWRNAEFKELKISLPIGISDLVRISPGNIILIQGETNTGKTTFLINVLLDNKNRGKKVFYFSSEDKHGFEFKDRLLKGGYTGQELDDLNESFTMINRTSDFAEVVVPDAINIIDYLEITQDFYLAGHKIKEIYDKLTTGIAVIAVQKNPNVDYARGGYQLMDKPRLVVSLTSAQPEGSIAVIEKAKMFKGEKSIRKNWQAFRIVNGLEIYGAGGWNEPEKKDDPENKKDSLGNKKRNSYVD